MQKLSNSAGRAKSLFFILIVFLFCLLLPGPLLADDYGTISGTVYENDGETPVQSDWGIAAFRASNHDFVSGSPIGVDGSYTITGLPPGDYLIRTEPSINHGAGIYYDNTPYFEQRSTITISGTEHITGIDFILEYPIFVYIDNIHNPDNTFTASYQIFFFLFDNFNPNSVVSIIMSDSSETPLYYYTREEGDQDDFEYIDQWKVFGVRVPGTQPELDEYSFTVVTDDFTTVARRTKTINKSMPIVSASTMSPVNNALISSRIPTFQWGDVDDFEYPVYYRFQIYDNTGYRIYTSGYEADLRSLAMPEGILQPGQTYNWWVRIYDHNDWTKVENISNSETFTFTMADNFTPGTNPPAIDLDGWGAVSWLDEDVDGTYLLIKVIDHDGISHDGSSHNVSATFNGKTFPLNHSGSDSAFEAYYQYWDGVTPASSGEYVFTVTDPEGNIATLTDTLVVNPQSFPPDNEVRIIEGGTTPTFSWNPVNGAVRYHIRIRDMNRNTVWNGYPVTGAIPAITVPPGILKPDTNYSYFLRILDSHSLFDVDNVFQTEELPFTTGGESVNPFIEITDGAATRNSGDQVTYLYFRTKVHDAQGVPGDIQSVTATLPGGTTIPLELDYNESDTCGIYYAEDFGLPIAAGDYTITVEDMDGNTHSVTDTLDVNPIGYPADAAISATVNGTQVDVTWDSVDGAAFYRLEIHDMEGNRLHDLSTTQNSYVIPAGYLKENTSYQYRITTWREFFDQGVDNTSKTVMKVFETGLNREMDMQGIILTAAVPDITISGGTTASIYGTAAPNHITLESGAYVELINFPGQNLIEIQSIAWLFDVYRSGTVVIFQGSDGTVLKIPATKDEQTILFDGKSPMLLQIRENKVMLNDQTITTSPLAVEIIPDGLAAYYPFNGNANDESGNGNNGVVNGADLTSDRFENDDSAYSFNGIDDIINLGTEVFTNDMNAFTIAAWIYPYEVSESGTNRQYTIVGERDGGDNFQFTVMDDFFYVSFWSNGEEQMFFGEPASIQANQWYFLAATYDGTTVRFYINGKQTGSFNASGTIDDHDSTLYIGSWNGANGMFKGKIDDIGFFTRALLKEEIVKLFEKGIPSS